MAGGKSKRMGLALGLGELWQRELGQIKPRSFTNRVGASDFIVDLIRRLAIHKELDKHRGCVNTVSFSAEGVILVSGSDDRMVMLWNWDSGSLKLSFHTGHISNVFQAKIMPFTNDQSIVTCAADGQVRYAQLQEGGGVEIVKLGKHDGRAHKLAVEPGSPHIFYTCAEDGLVQHFDLRTWRPTKLFTCYPISNRSTSRWIVSLNAITINPRNPCYFSIGGSDEYARLYDIRKCKWNKSSRSDHPADCFCPTHLVGDGQVGISGLSFSEQSELLVSYNDELIYLFSKDMGLGSDPSSASESFGSSPSKNGELGIDTNGCEPQVYTGHRNCDTVKGVNFFGPYSEYVVSGSDCGHMFIWRKKDGELLRAMEGDKHVVNCIEPHPHDAVLASSGLEHDVKIWTPKASQPSTLPVNVDEIVKYRDRITGFAFNYYTDDDDEDDFDLDDVDFIDDDYNMDDRSDDHIIMVDKNNDDANGDVDDKNDVDDEDDDDDDDDDSDDGGGDDDRDGADGGGNSVGAKEGWV